MQYVEMVQKCDGKCVINLYGRVSTYIFYNFFMKELHQYTHKIERSKEQLTI